MSTTFTRLFKRSPDASAAVAELRSIGVPRSDVSLVADDAGKLRVIHGVDATVGLRVDEGALVIPGLGSVVATGWLVSTGRVAATTAGLIPALTTAGMSFEEASVLSEGVSRGGILVCVKYSDKLAREVEAIFERHNAVNLPPRNTDYRIGGWWAPDGKVKTFGCDAVFDDRRKASATAGKS